MKHPKKLSPYRMGWLIAMFDLPVLLEHERKAAARFRKDLQDDGFLMMQYSVYARPCVSLEKMEKHLERIRRIAPCAGNIRLLFISDRQWGTSVLIQGDNYRPALPRSTPEQIEFW